MEPIARPMRRTSPSSSPCRGENPNGASIRFLVEGADLPADITSYERLAILFDGNDVQALAFARDQWRAVKEGSHDATYWQQDERGRWQRKA